MYGNFLQSAEWEEFQKRLGRKTWRVDGALVIQHDLPYGFNYLYCPKPVDIRDGFLNAAEKIARKEKSIFLKIDPVEVLQATSYKLQVSHSLQPQKTIILDLTEPENELLAAMHEKTRYNIRLAERRGVTIHDIRNTIHDFDNFWMLLQETAKRDGFHTHGREYYEKLLQTKSENFLNELFFAEYQGKLLAAVIINFYQGAATYLHGASSREHREVMAPHLLHWYIIKEAKRRGFRQYDFWGIDEKKWSGLTRFKMGFGGEVVEYPESIDAVYRPITYVGHRLAKFVKMVYNNIQY